ncbi:lysylphosphatidylglycerol synthase domain-containing protein [Cesiribacter sp. SM1]|uniref:lysylphosphatidylglycerol synthase domain-containing protein n=1 Tax=Cesiribacter sp. SM1 TaxID=2861196 RepID=UPI001CD44923|nr:lysylphosphatidylglycerol synthase domain-containing protein [Cesiribacter sp. SM1]
MQFSTLSTLKTKSYIKYVSAGLKVFLLLGMLYFVGTKLWQHQESMQRMFLQLKEGWGSPANQWVLAALLLVPVNWLLEAVKWQVLVRRVAPASLGRCVQAVLSGLCLGMITPRSLGDYAGRILVHGGAEKVRLIGAVLINRMVQTISTLAGGIAGILILVWQLGYWQSDEIIWLLVPGLLGLAMLVLLIGPLRETIFLWIGQKLDEKWVKWIGVLNEYSVRELVLINVWAFLRYAVFSMQFIFVLWWAGITAPLLLMVAAVAGTFLLKSLLPAFNFLSDLGVREFSALIVFSGLELPHAEVIAASLLLWIINLCLPSLLGLGVVLQLKYKENLF